MSLTKCSAFLAFALSSAPISAMPDPSVRVVSSRMIYEAPLPIADIADLAEYHGRRASPAEIARFIRDQIFRKKRKATGPDRTIIRIID